MPLLNEREGPRIDVPYDISPDIDIAFTLATKIAFDQQQDLGIEQLFWGLVEESGQAAYVISRLNFEPNKLTEAIEFVRSTRDEERKIVLQEDTKITPVVQKSLEFAIREARARGRKELSTEDMLVGLISAWNEAFEESDDFLNSEEGLIAGILESSGLNIIDVRAKIIEIEREIPRLGDQPMFDSFYPELLPLPPAYEPYDRESEDRARAERYTIRESFTDEEKKALIEDGALIFEYGGEKFEDQQVPHQKEYDRRHPQDDQSLMGAFLVSHNPYDRPSRLKQVAVYPAPDKTFVDGTFNKDLKTQEQVIEADAERLRIILGIENIEEILPDEPSIVTDIIFQHFKNTGELLLGSECAALHQLQYVSTRTRGTRGGDSYMNARVRGEDPRNGVGISYSNPGRDALVGALRFVVPVDKL